MCPVTKGPYYLNLMLSVSLGYTNDVCFNYVSNSFLIIIQESYKRVTRELHESYRRVTCELHESYMRVTGELQESYRRVTRELQESYRRVT